MLRPIPGPPWGCRGPAHRLNGFPLLPAGPPSPYPLDCDGAGEADADAARAPGRAPQASRGGDPEDPAGAEGRKALGIPVLSGMLGVTLFGLIFTPVFYVLVKRFSKNKPSN